MPDSERTYLSGLDSIRFPYNQNQPCGLNSKESSINNYVTAYIMLDKIKFGRAVGVLTMNEIVDSQFFALPKSDHFGGKALKKELRDKIEALEDDPLKLLKEGIERKKIIVSTYRTSPDAPPQTLCSYAHTSFKNAKKKNEVSPTETAFFIPSHMTFLSYNVNGYRKNPCEDGTPSSEEKTDKALKNDYLDVLISFFSRDTATVCSYYRGNQSNVNKDMPMLTILEALSKDPGNVKLPISNLNRLKTTTKDILTYVKRMYELEELCAKHNAYEVQESDVTYSTAFRDFWNDGLLELLCDRFDVKEGQAGSSKRQCCLEFANVLKYHIQAIEKANRSDAYAFIQNKDVSFDIVRRENNKTHKRTYEEWVDALDKNYKYNIIDSINNNFVSKMNNVATAYANNIYNYHYALRSKCAYIAGGVNDGALARTPIGACINCRKGENDEWII